MVGISSGLNAMAGDYVVIDGDAYQLGASTGSVGTIYNGASGTYNDCDDAISNASNGCRYDFEPCCDDGVSYFAPPKYVQTSNILTVGTTRIGTNPSNGVDTCMLIQTYSGNYTLNNTYLTVFPEVLADCNTARCSRCAYRVQVCGGSGLNIIWVIAPGVSNIQVGNVYYDSGLQTYLTANFLGVISNCVTITLSSAGPTSGTYSSDALGNTYNLVGNCLDPSC